ncbi:branched-chain amino acid ABC transporter permease [Amorphus sp. 3PC139-8]|uniref:branched-chain amino acid ABC transporter permease n=1 Tax=Amorphus sp. 3PC139-8 TaxID=2735676 RepID=UPI00345DFA9B
MIDLIAYTAFSLTFAVIFAVAALGLNLQFGYAGLFNVGIAGFFAIGAYTSAILTGPEWASSLGGFGLPVPIGIVAAGVTSAIAAYLVGAAVLRLGGDHLAIATFGIGVSIQIAVTNLGAITNGPNGLFGIPRPFRDGSALLSGNLAWLATCVLVMAAIWWVLAHLTATPWGRTLRALSEDETASAGLGKDVRRFKLEAFTIGSTLCGVSGALYAHFAGFISPHDFLPILTFQIYAMVIIGGTGNNLGTVVGSVIVWVLWSASGAVLGSTLPADWQSKAGALRIILIAIVLLAVLHARPGGLFGERPPGLRRREQATDDASSSNPEVTP